LPTKIKQKKREAVALRSSRGKASEVAVGASSKRTGQDRPDRFLTQPPPWKGRQHLLNHVQRR